MFLKLYCIILVVLHVQRAVYTLTVVLSPPVIDVIENNSVTLTCSGNETDNITQSTWSRTSSSVIAFMFLAQNGPCLTKGFITDRDLYDVNCDKNKTFSLTLKHVLRSENGEEWRCWINTFSRSNTSTIYVKVPVESASITSHLDEKELSIKENSTTNFTCRTKPSRPIPTISWFLNDTDMKSTINITEASSQSPQAGDSLNFAEVESVLKYVFNRSHNGWHIYCQASNLPGRSVTSLSKLLFIIYPPDGAPTLTGIHDGSVLSIVEYQKANVLCTVSGGNPPANLTWNCFNGSVTESHKNGKIISNITWTVLRKQQNKSCTCVSEHTCDDFNASVSVIVLYSPDKPTFSVQSKIVENQIEVIQNNSLNVVCTSESNPDSDYKWTKGSNLVGKGQQLTINRTQKKDIGEYGCDVNNTMIGSNGFVKDGRNSSNISLHVLYPPNNPTFRYVANTFIGMITRNAINVIKEDVFEIICQSASHPSPEYKWENNQTGNKSMIIAGNPVNKTCTATNTMTETVGESREGSASSTLLVNVLYPPMMPQIIINKNTAIQENVSDNLSVIEKTSFNLSCTSQGNPIPIYKWYVNSSEVSTHHTLQHMHIGRHQHGFYTCRASNIMIRTFGEEENGSSLRNITVDVLFPPNNPMFRYINVKLNETVTGTVIYVIKGDEFKIMCQAVGHPVPDYKWENNQTSNTSIIIAGSSVNKTCTATNTMTETVGETREGSASSTLFVDVLYAPTMQHIYINNDAGLNQNVSYSFSVVEKDSFILTCTSKGNPMPNYTWYVSNSEITVNQELVHMNISRHQRGMYTCEASNIMIRTFGEEEIGSSIRNTTVDVLYPAEVGNLINITVEEGSFINVTCPVILGNPPLATIKWTPGGDLGRSNSSTLYISNISRNDEKLYICSVTSLMRRTYGLQKEEINYGQFQLTVNYKARVTEFYIGAETNRDVYTVNETEDVTFTCNIDSKPEPTTTILLNEEILNISNKRSITYSRENIQCTDMRLYQCTGINQYNINSQSVMNLTLYVNCRPRPSPIINVKTNVTSARNTMVTFSFTTLAYPEPGPAGFIWSFIQRSDIIALTNNSNVFISNTQIQSNLTIRNITNENYGKYILRIKNTIGVYEHTFRLEPQGDKGSISNIEGSSSTTVAVAVSVSCVTAVIVVIVIALLFYRKQRHDNDTRTLLYQNIPFTGNIKNKNNNFEKSKIEETPLEGLQEIDDVPKVTHEPVEYYNSQDVLETIDRIKVSELFSYLTGKDEDSFGIDYQKLPTGLEKPCTFARKPENLAKNRYNGIYPYDHSRVKLHGDPDFFINACYIDGYKRTKAYIASLGPTAKTTSDFKTFWQMIWHEQSDIIVMLTNLREPSGMKCEQYWPEHGDSICYGDITVTGQNIEIFAEYTVRIFLVLKDDESRTVTHLHYTSWPDKKVPEDTISLLEFRQRIKITPTGSKSPVVVHCSAGIGRTGTLIALDRLIEEGQSEGSVNVYECVLSMREQRVKMVQTLEQYIYIYKALVSALVFDSEIIPLESNEDYMDTASNTTYSYQFKHLQQSVDTESKEEKESRTVNAARTTQNRTGADIPAALGRVFLYLNREADDSDYINAVYMNSFKRKEYFIVAQTPLKNTVKDFMCMLYQEDCTCIVSMEDMKEPGTSVGVYLPSDGQKLKFGQFIVSCTRLEMSHHCIVRKVIIQLNGKNENGEKTLYHFQYTNWMSANDRPMNASEFVQFVTEVEEYANQFCEERSHVLVHCLNANERSGLFCAVTTLIEKLKYERQVNILNTLRHIRTRRKTSITSMEQLKFCYQAGSVYIKMFRP